MCYCPADDGVCDFSTSHIVRARKAHTCAECNRIIHPGERYRRSAAKWEGSVSSWRTCVECAAWGEALGEARAARRREDEARFEAAMWRSRAMAFRAKLRRVDPAWEGT